MTQRASTLSRASRIASVAAISVIAALVMAATAHAGAFPGTNGRVALTSPSFSGTCCHIVTANPDGSDLHFLTTSDINTLPAYSPDGTKIAWVVGSDAGREIWVMNADNTGSNKQQVTSNAEQDDNPAWSPDGTQIVITRELEAGNFEIYVRDAGPGGSETNLTSTEGNDYDPSWSPDGTRIAFVSSRTDLSNPEGDEEIYTMDADGSNQTNVTNNSGVFSSDQAPNWSPDGSEIVFTTNRDGGQHEIYMMDANGANPTNLTNSPATDLDPAWSPDGTKIVFRSNRLGGSAGYDIVFMDANGSNQNIPASAPFDQRFPDWQPVVDSYGFPIGATPTRVSLVPAFEACSTPNASHQVAVGVTSQSCTSPVHSSSISAVGPTSAGFARIVACLDGSVSPCNTLSSFPDVKLRVNITDVRAVTPSGVDYNPNASGSDLTARMRLRLTDKRNGSGFAEPGTLQDVNLEIPMDCSGSSQADPQIPNSVGSNCDANTSANALYPGIAVAGKRALFDLGQVQVFDSGLDRVRGNSDDKLLEAQGVAVP